MNKEELKKVLELLITHSDHIGGYCDTGDDMDWACRSECVEMAEKRIKEYFEPLLED